MRVHDVRKAVHALDALVLADETPDLQPVLLLLLLGQDLPGTLRLVEVGQETAHEARVAVVLASALGRLLHQLAGLLLRAREEEGGALGGGLHRVVACAVQAGGGLHEVEDVGAYSVTSYSMHSARWTTQAVHHDDGEVTARQSMDFAYQWTDARFVWIIRTMDDAWCITFLFEQLVPGN